MTTAAFAVSSEMLAPITEAVTSNLSLLVPVGIGIMALLIGVSLIPKIIYRFF